MVRDGYYYGIAFLAAGAVMAWLTAPAWGIPAWLLALFFVQFFRDPERRIPDIPGAIVSPGDGKVTDVSTLEFAGGPRTRISIFLNVFNVHVNRSPIAGTIRAVEYRKGRFGNAVGAVSAEENEQNIVTVEGEGETVVFKQIAGLLARRIVFTKKVGDRLARGERVGMIKFGSRVDVLMPADVAVQVKVGDKVAGGSTVLALAPARRAQAHQVMPAAPASVRGGGR